MVNPGTFRGQRKEYLTSCKPDYQAASDNGTLEDCLALIIQGYFRRFPPEMPLNYDPTDEEITKAMEREYEEPSLPDAERLSESEFEVEMARWKERTATIKKIKAKISRWLSYQYLKDNSMVKKNLKGSHNAYASLIFQLSGKRMKKPRLLSAMSVWRRTPSIRESLERAARARCIAQKKPLKTGLAPAREEIANSRFNLLSEEEQESYANQGIREHDAAMKQWKKDKKKPLKTDPRSRQQCIANLPAVVQPLLDLIADATGWKVTLLAGGPCPARGGRMSMVNVHSGTTRGEVPMTFGQFESVRYKKYLTPMFTNFLRNAYTVEECRERALVGDDADVEMPAFDDADPNGPTFELLPELNGASSNLGSNSEALSQRTESGDQQSPPPPPPPPPASTQYLNPPSSRPKSLSPDSDSESPSSPSLPDPESPPASPPPLPSASSQRLQQPLSPLASPSSSPLPLPLPLPEPTPAPSRSARLPSPPLPAPPSQRLQQPPLASSRSSPSLPPPEPVAASSRLAQPTSTSAASAAASRVPNKRPPEDLALETEPRRKSARVTPAGATGQKKTKTVKGKGKGTDERKDGDGGSPNTLRPAWFLDGMSCFTEGATGLGTDGSGSLGDDWIALVHAWSSFQQAAGFSEDSKLPTKNRPFPIKEWIARARSPTYRPVIKDLREYETTFWLWWSSMQPEWRKVDGKVDPKRVDGDWSCLRLPGVNGLISVVAALLYWGIAAHGSKARTVAWSKAVRDCTMAFSKISALS
ncbi:hypothetical protein CVT24_007929 [Panaeolus cyanescens]|uniref:Uncharacterized protein n=1 Tax=Panaeolus cyanescens TaxID=181874 RepID=A0A409X012_9AGAR|nr:hypothetical protein CVT24_007929 [Panaeolus cyanescens]